MINSQIKTDKDYMVVIRVGRTRYDLHNHIRTLVGPSSRIKEIGKNGKRLLQQLNAAYQEIELLRYIDERTLVDGHWLNYMLEIDPDLIRFIDAFESSGQI